jgi:patatin-like phospholipase/acyl hydrolase
MALWDLKQKTTAPQQEERFILSIDGGGMRGIIPAVLLAKLASLLEHLGDNRPLYSHFDLIAGTSTGGLLALAMTSPVEKTNLAVDSRYVSYIYEQQERSFWEKLRGKKEEELLLGTLPFGIDVSTLESLYLKHGKQIFPKSQGRIFSQIFIDKYDEAPLERFLKHMFKDTPLSEAVVPTLVVSYDASNGKPFLISSMDSHQFLFWEAARATSAAPTFFKPAYLYDRQEQVMQTLIDGGVVANNPSLYAYKEAKRLYPDAKKFHILSLSTASSDFTFTVSGAGTGVIGWIDPAKGAPIQKIYATSQMQVIDQIAPTIDDLSYTRIHGRLGEEYKLDATNPLALASMSQGALQIFQENEEAMQSFAEKLAKRTKFDQLTLGPKEVVVPEQKADLSLPPPEPAISNALSSYNSFLQRYHLEEEKS